MAPHISSAFVGLTLLLSLAPGPAGAPLAGQGRSPSAGARTDLTRLDAQHMRDKVSAIEQRANLLAKPPAKGERLLLPSTTIVTEREVNSYLAFEAAAQIPTGIAQPRIGILGARRLSGTAVVDLDAVRVHHKSKGWFDPMSYLSGRLPVALVGRLTAAGGVARFELESARLAGVPIPKTLVQELVSYYSRTPGNPQGLNLDDPFPLPARIRQIDVRPGEAVVVQQ